MRRGGARHPLVELTLARVREFFREPEAIFWAFVFPLVLTLALAAAFPSAADRPVVVGLVPGTPDGGDAARAGGGPGAACGGPVAGRGAAGAARRHRAHRGGGERPADLPLRPRTGREPPRPAGGGRCAEARRRTRGSVERRRGARRGAGLALCGLADPGADRHGHHDQRTVGRGVPDRQRPPAEAAEAHDGQPDAAMGVFAGAGAGAPDLPGARSHAAAGVRQSCARHADRRDRMRSSRWWC